MYFRVTFLLLFCLPIFTSCIRYKKLLYLKSKNDADAVFTYVKNPYKIRTGDNLDIKFSSTDANTSAILNKESGLANSSQVNSASLYVNGYSVGDVGTIEIPLIGKVFVKGLTIPEIHDTLIARLESYLSIKNVIIKISNFRVTILGEVKAPGTQFIYSDNVNIFQALGLAGDLTDLANRKKIKVLRSDDNNSGGKISYIDISNPNCISSENFYLLPNDVVYVEPIRAKGIRGNLAYITLFITLTTAVLFLIRRSY